MFTKYIEEAMNRAQYEILPDDKLFYGEIPGCDGVWATGSSLETCRRELQEVLEEWLMFRIANRMPVPVMGDITLTIPEAV